MLEIWQPVVGFEGAYEVSDQGRVRSMARPLMFTSKTGGRHTRMTKPLVLAQVPLPAGYLLVNLCRDGKRHSRTVHSIVAEAFIGPRPAGMDVAHNDGNPQHNAPANLRYATRAENHADKRLHGTAAVGSMIRQAKLTEADVEWLRLPGGPPAPAAAKWFGVSPRTVRRVRRGETWKHV